MPSPAALWLCPVLARREFCAIPWLWVMLVGSMARGSPMSRGGVLDGSAGQWEGRSISIQAPKCAAC